MAADLPKEGGNLVDLSKEGSKLSVAGVHEVLNKILAACSTDDFAKSMEGIFARHIKKGTDEMKLRSTLGMSFLMRVRPTLESLGLKPDGDGMRTMLNNIHDNGEDATVVELTHAIEGKMRVAEGTYFGVLGPDWKPATLTVDRAKEALQCLKVHCTSPYHEGIRKDKTGAAALGTMIGTCVPVCLAFGFSGGEDGLWLMAEAVRELGAVPEIMTLELELEEAAHVPRGSMAFTAGSEAEVTLQEVSRRKDSSDWAAEGLSEAFRTQPSPLEVSTSKDRMSLEEAQRLHEELSPRRQQKKAATRAAAVPQMCFNPAAPPPKPGSKTPDGPLPPWALPLEQVLNMQKDLIEGFGEKALQDRLKELMVEYADKRNPKFAVRRIKLLLEVWKPVLSKYDMTPDVMGVQKMLRGMSYFKLEVAMVKNTLKLNQLLFQPTAVNQKAVAIAALIDLGDYIFTVPAPPGSAPASAPAQ